MSKFYYKVKGYYDTLNLSGERYWDINKVKNAVVKQWITEDEFKEITGEDYVASAT